MYSREETKISREVPAIQIPDGTPVVIPHGTRVLITQELGGAFTVMTDRGALFRIDPENADALGKEVAERPVVAAEGESVEERVWSQMKKCYDPEIPVNIVDLGLVYDCTVEERPEGEKLVRIQMTLTAPGCGMGPILADDVKRRIEELPEIAEARVEVVFDPPWNQNMMSEAARLQLGFM